MYGESYYYWYDLETFGTSPKYDRIAQFAGIRTNTNFETVGDPDLFYVKLSGDYIPNPEACIVTGITPQMVREKGIPECEAAEKIFRIFSSKPNTCICGYNSISFDDEFIRNLFYRNFIDPYVREYENGCSRWDIIDLVRATHDLRPEGIIWPENSEGKPSFKLTDLTSANKIEHLNAHDALSDVRATISLASLIKNKQNALYEYYFKLREKNNVKEILRKALANHDMLLHVNKIYTSENGCTNMIVPLDTNIKQTNSYWCFILSEDPVKLLSSDDGGKFPEGLITVSANKCPFICTPKTIDKASTVRLGLNMSLIEKHLDYIIDHIGEITKKISTFNLTEDRPLSDPDLSIYSGFFGSSDKRLFKAVRETPPSQRLNLNFNFIDSRCKPMLFRHVARNYYNFLDEQQKKDWRMFCKQRIYNPPEVENVFSVRVIQSDIENHLKDPGINPEDKFIYQQVSDYINNIIRFVNSDK